MSFTSIVKKEVSTLNIIETEQIAELSAIIYNIGNYQNSTIKITTENSSVARRVFSLFKNLYGVIAKITVRKGYNYNKNYIYILEITHKVEDILIDLGLYQNSFLTLPKLYIIDDEELKKAYIRGIFLAVGSLNDPKKSRYHLELLVENEEYASFVCNLLNHFYLNAKYLKRENKFMVYLKEAEKIGDFLRMIQAMNAVLYYEDIRIYRDQKNKTNRLNNCEQANVDKMIMAATNQIKDIELLKKEDVLELLDDKVKEVALYRIKYPEASLGELSEIISLETGVKITKSGVHHRLKKIQEIASKIKDKK